MRKVSKFKTKTFDKCADIICKHFCIEREDLFKKSREVELVDARRILYLTCYYKGFKPVTINALMAINGYVTQHSTISSGIKRMEEKAENNKDYKRMVKRLCSR